MTRLVQKNIQYIKFVSILNFIIHYVMTWPHTLAFVIYISSDITVFLILISLNHKNNAFSRLSYLLLRWRMVLILRVWDCLWRLVGGSAFLLTKHVTFNKLASVTNQLTTTSCYCNKVLQATPYTCFTPCGFCSRLKPSVSGTGTDCIENNMFGF